MQSLETKSSRPRPKSFQTETETRSETFEIDTKTATSKNGSLDASRDRVQVSRLHHWIVLTNGDDKSDLVISIVQSCLLPRCEALHTCCLGFLTATEAQHIQAVSILLHGAKSVLGLFCLHLNTID